MHVRHGKGHETEGRKKVVITKGRTWDEYGQNAYAWMTMSF